MILRKCLPVAGVFLVVFIFFAESSSSSSGRRSSSSKSKGRSESDQDQDSEAFHTSGHQYGHGHRLKPSKPDPHFEILNEQQKGYKKYYRKGREGRAGDGQVKRTTLKEVVAPSSSSSSQTKGCCKKSRSEKSSKSSSSSSSHRSAPPPSSLASSASYESQGQLTFAKKSSMERFDSVEPTPEFAGSMLISGDAGMSTSFKANRQSADVMRDGWKILNGPSIPPVGEEEGEYLDYAGSDNTIGRRAYTSLTDGGQDQVHRTITKLPQRETSKSRGNLKYASMDEFASLKRFTGGISSSNARSGSSSSYSKSRRSKPSSSSGHKSSHSQMQVSIPKQTLQHKYATITRRQPSQSSSKGSLSEPEQVSSAKKAKMSASDSKSRYSTQIKSSSSDSKSRRGQSHYRKYSSGENSLTRFNPSPAMTLDMKKLVLEPISSSSAEPSTIPMMMTSSRLSLERYSGETEPDNDDENENDIDHQGRFDRLSLPSEDLIAEDDDDSNGAHSRHNHFQTKTAMNVGEYPLVSVSTSLYNNHPKEQGGIIIASSASSEDFPQLPRNPLDPPVDFDALAAQSNHRVDEESEVEGVGLMSGFTPSLTHLDNMPPTHLRLLPPPPPPPPGGGSSHGRILARPVQEPLSASMSAAPSPSDSSSSSSQLMPMPPPPYRSSMLPPYPPPRSYYPPHMYYAHPYPHDLPSGYYHDKFSVEPSHPPKDSSTAHSETLPTFQDHDQAALALGHHPPHHPHFHPHSRHPSHYPFLPPFPLSSALHHHPIGIPLEIGSGRKAPFGELVGELGKPILPHSAPPPPPGVDPDHPAIQHALTHPQTLLRDGIFIQPTDSSNLPETTKNYLQYSVHKNSLVPLDKRLVYLSMIFSWMFWITAFYTYYRYYVTGHKTKQVTLNVPHDGEHPQVVAARALDMNSPWNFTKVLEYIEIAQKTYEGFDWQDLNCQKRTLCELVQKQNDPWGETGRKLANSYVYRAMDALDGVPVPQMIQTYLKQYKEAITLGKNPTNDCGQIYSQCKFSIKDVLSKAGQKKKA